jgi:hypothetical protein
MKYVSNQTPGLAQVKSSIVAGDDSGGILASVL